MSQRPNDPMPYDPMDRARRRQRRRQQLGPDACCALCGEMNPDVLLKVQRSVLELHHVLGEAHDPEFTIVVCRNCHAKCSAAQQDDGVPLTPQPTALERLVAVTAAAGSFFQVMGGTLLVWAERGHEIVRKLDDTVRDWRDRV